MAKIKKNKYIAIDSIVVSLEGRGVEVTHAGRGESVVDRTGSNREKLEFPSITSLFP